MSLVYIGLAQNVTPLVTVFMSYIMTGEKLKSSDIYLIIVTFIGVTLITAGYREPVEKQSQPPTLAIVGAFLIPFLLSYGNILMSKMKGLNENTVSLYMNPSLSIIMYAYLWSADIDLVIFKTLGAADWILIVFFSINTVIVQTLKFIALQNEEPAKLGPW